MTVIKYRLLLFVLCYSCMGISACQSNKKLLVADRKIKMDTSNEEKYIREVVINAAKSYEGTKYKRGGRKNDGLDCSGLVIKSCQEARINMAACSADQSNCGQKVDIDDAKPGDILFFGTKNRVSHVGIVFKNSKAELLMIHSSSSRGVIVENVLKSDYWIKRLLYAKDLMSYLREPKLSTK